MQNRFIGYNIVSNQDILYDNKLYYNCLVLDLDLDLGIMQDQNKQKIYAKYRH